MGICKPTSNVFLGDPFIPPKIISLDLLLHSKHFEQVHLFGKLYLISAAALMERMEAESVTAVEAMKQIGH